MWLGLWLLDCELLRSRGAPAARELLEALELLPGVDFEESALSMGAGWNCVGVSTRKKVVGTAVSEHRKRPRRMGRSANRQLNIRFDRAS